MNPNAFFTPPVGQLAKTHIPTSKANENGTSEVGRQPKTELHTPTHAGTHTYEAKTTAPPDPIPNTKQARQSLEDISRFMTFVRIVQPQKRVCMGQHSGINSVRKTCSPKYFNLFAELVKTFALLHQQYRQTHPDKKNTILANEQDFISALRVIKHKIPEKRTRDFKTGKTSLIKHLLAHYQNRAFSRRSLCKDLDYSPSYIKEILYKMHQEGTIVKQPQKHGNFILYRLATNNHENHQPTSL